MKEAELREVCQCTICGRKPGETSSPIFWLVKLERFMLDATAIQRQTGLAMMMGSARLAAVMGPDEDMAHPIGDCALSVCEECALEGMPLLVMMERANQPAIRGEGEQK